MSPNNELVEVYMASNEGEAEVIKGLLESIGIPCLLKYSGAYSSSIFAVTGPGLIKVMVSEKDAEEARKILAEDIVQEDIEEDNNA